MLAGIGYLPLKKDQSGSLFMQVAKRCRKFHLFGITYRSGGATLCPDFETSVS